MPIPRTPIDLCARLSAATARAGKMLDAAPRAGVDLRDMSETRIRLEGHEHEYDRAREPWRRHELVKLMDEDIGVLAAGFKKLEAAV
jgi:hypothetical protein